MGEDIPSQLFHRLIAQIHKIAHDTAIMCGGKKVKQKPGGETNLPQASQSLDSLMTSLIPHITKPEELEEILSTKAEQDQLVVVDFYAKWCGPCIRMSTIIEAWVKEFSDVIFVKADIDKCDIELPEQFSIQSIPTFILFKNGQKIDQFLGSKHPVLRHMIDQYRKGALPRPSVMEEVGSANSASPPPSGNGVPVLTEGHHQNNNTEKKKRLSFLSGKGNKKKSSGGSTSKDPTHFTLKLKNNKPKKSK